MTSHLLYMTVFAFLVSLVFAVLLKDRPREQLRFGAMTFAAFIFGALALGSLMFPCPCEGYPRHPGARTGSVSGGPWSSMGR